MLQQTLRFLILLVSIVLVHANIGKLLKEFVPKDILDAVIIGGIPFVLNYVPLINKFILTDAKGMPGLYTFLILTLTSLLLTVLVKEANKKEDELSKFLKEEVEYKYFKMEASFIFIVLISLLAEQAGQYIYKKNAEEEQINIIIRALQKFFKNRNTVRNLKK